MKFKTIIIPEEIKKKLDEIKIHPREPYWEVIEKLIKKCGEVKE